MRQSRSPSREPKSPHAAERNARKRRNVRPAGQEAPAYRNRLGSVFPFFPLPLGEGAYQDLGTLAMFTSANSRNRRLARGTERVWWHKHRSQLQTARSPGAGNEYLVQLQASVQLQPAGR